MKTSIKCKTNWFLAVLTSFGLILDRFFEKPVATTLDRSFSGPGTIPRLPKAVQSGFLPKKAKKPDWTGLLNSIDEGSFLFITKRDGVFFQIHSDALLKMRVLEKRGTSLGLVQRCRCGQDDLVKGANCLAGGLHTQMVCQIKGLNSIIECRRAVVGGTRGVDQGVWINCRNWAILIMDVGGELGILGVLMVSVCLLATMVVVGSLSLGRSVSAATAIGSALLLLLLGELGIRLLALHSTKLYC